jgi:hypothetical protein
MIERRIRALIQKALRHANMSSLSSLIDAAVMGNTEEVIEGNQPSLMRSLLLCDQK